MTRLYYFLCCIAAFLTITSGAYAQAIVTVGTGTSTGATNVFVATSTSTNNYSLNYTIYNAVDIIGAGGFAGMISKLAWEKAGTGEMTSNSEITVYLKHVNFSQHATGTETWASVINGATLVYSNNAFMWPAGTGFKDITLQTPFLWNGSDNLAVLVEWHKNTQPTANVSWAYTSATNANKWKIGTTPVVDMASINSSRANLQLTMTPNGPCTAPPAPGVATANPATPICTGTPIDLNLSGVVFGSGQDYYWESSLTNQPGSFSPISVASISPLLTVNPTVTTYYRAVVTCSGQSDTSAVVMVTVNPSFPPGTYTIDAGSPASATNFQSFTDAVNALNCGIAGPIVFEVVPGSGPYNEQIIIPQIGGASSTNTITFNGRGNTLQFSPSVSADRYIIRLDGADHIIIDSLNIVGNGTTYGWGVHLINQADSNVIKRSVIDMSAATSTTAANTGGIVVSNSNTSATTQGSNANYLQIIDNEIIGAYRGIIIYGSTGATNGKGHLIENNTIRDFYADGIVLANTDSARVIGNDIHRMNRVAVTSFAGIELAVDAQRTLVMNNRIHDTHNSATTQSGLAYGLLSSTNDVAPGVENYFINNLIYNFNSTTGTQYGIYNNSSNGARYYHNTISLDNQTSTSGATRGISLASTATTQTSNVTFINNMVNVTREGTGTKYAVNFGTGSSPVSENNNLFIASPSGTVNVGAFGSTDFATIVDWQTANSGAWDQLSKSNNPLFVNAAAGDLTPSNGLVDDAGVPVGVATDITGANRAAIPDIGAYEFSVPFCSPVSVTAGTTTAPDAICLGESFQLEATGFTSGNGITLQWQYFDAGLSTYVDIPNATTSIFTITGQTALTYYRFVVTCSNGGISDYAHDTVDVNAFYRCYCTPVITSGGTEITNVTIQGTTLNNTTGAASAPFYESYPIAGSTTATLVQNQAYTIDVSLGSAGITSMWIDYNQDGIYDTDEWVQVGTSGTSHSATFTVPLAALPGLTGMRVRSRASGANGSGNPCTSMTLAETEDYVITIAPAQPCSGSPVAGNATGPVNPLCVSGDASLVLDGFSADLGIQIQWEYFDGTAWLPVANADTANVLVTGIAATTDYRAAVTCLASTTTTYSNTITVTVVSPQITSTTPASLCGAGSVTLAAASSSGTTINWYDQPTGGQVLGTGTTFATPVISTTTNYYASAITSAVNLSGGRTAPAGATNLSASPRGIVFTANQSFNLVSVTVFSTSATNGSGTIELRDNLGAVIGGPVAVTWPGGGTAANPVPHVLTVNIPVPAGVNHRLLMSSFATGGIAYETSNITGTWANYTPSNNAFVMTASATSATASGTTTYYYFYDWVISAGCESPRSIVTATVNPATPVTVAATPDTICSGTSATITATSSNAGYTYTWTPGNLTGSSVSVSPAATTTYYLTSVDNATNCTDLDTVVVFVRGVPGNSKAIASPETICVSGNVDFALNEVPFPATDYQWQEFNGTTFVDIANATGATYSTTVSASNIYRMRFICNGSTVGYSVPDTVTVSNPSVLNTFPGSRCGPGPVTLAATPSANATLKWYASATGGASVGSGNVFTTPAITATTDYYVSAAEGGGTILAGRQTPFATSTGFNGNNYGMVFDATSSFVLTTVDVYPTTATGSLTVELLNNSGTVIQTAGPFTLPAGTGTTFGGGATPYTLNLNFNILPGTNYKIRTASHSGSIIRDNPIGSNFSYPLPIGSVGNITGGWLAGSANTNTYYNFYNWQVVAGCESARTMVTATVNGAPSGTGLSTGGTVAGVNHADGTTVSYTDACNDLVATIADAPGGNTLGTTSAIVLSTSTVQTFNGAPYVPRVFDINPASDGPATVTLYALQSDFNAYNTYVTTNSLGLPLLPTGPSDAAGIANIVLTQYHGSAFDGTTGPNGLYDASQKEFIPNTSITASSNGTYWTITFPVSGFSGFFIHTGNGPLVIDLAKISATNFGDRNRVDWSTHNEASGDKFELERSADGRNFAYLATVNAKGQPSTYSYWDEKPFNGVNHYRLKMKNVAGQISYSAVVTATVKGNGLFSVEAFPNPVSDKLTVKVYGITAANAEVTILDVTGKLISTVKVLNNEATVDMSGLAQGAYIVKYTDANNTQTIKVNKQ